MKIVVATFTLLLLLSLGAFAQNSEQIILQLDDKLLKARINNDVAAMEKLMSDDWKFFGQFESSARLGLTDHRKANINTWKTFKVTELTESAQKVIFWNENTALVTGKLKEVSTSNFGVPMYMTFRHVWVKLGGEWKEVLEEQHYDPTNGMPEPAGWDSASNTTTSYVLDTEEKHGGNSSLMVRSNHHLDKPVGSGLDQMINAEAYRGKRVKLSGYIKGHVDYGYAFPWMRVNAIDGRVSNFDNTSTGFYIGKEWQRFSIVLDVAEDSLAIVFGFQLNGRGQIWLDDWSFEVVDKNVPSTNQPETEQVKKRNEMMQNAAGYKAFYANIKNNIGTYPKEPSNLDFEKAR